MVENTRGRYNETHIDSTVISYIPFFLGRNVVDKAVTSMSPSFCGNFSDGYVWV
jgi:hypothetical protein